MRTIVLFTFFLFALCFSNISYGQSCISNVVVTQDECTPFGEYNAFVTFENSPNVDSVSIFFDGAFFGNHDASFQPIVLSPILFEQNGNNIHLVEVESTSSSTCRDEISFEGICNFGANDCVSELFFVDAFCVDSTLQFEVNYTFLNPVSEGHIYVNDVFIANTTTGENQSLSFSVDNINPQGVYEVVVRDAEFSSCGDTLTTQVAPCTENCTAGFDYSTTCNSDGTFNISLFHSDSLLTKVYVNNEFISLLEPEANSPFLIEGIEIDTNQLAHSITTCLESSPSCCRTITFEQPDCAPCDINLTLNESSCQGFFPVFDITYDIANPVGTPQFIVNGSVIQSAQAGENVSLLLNPEIINDQGIYIIELVDPASPSCADTLIINEFFCEECVVETSNLLTECIAGTENYLVEVDIFNSGLGQVLEYFIIHQTGETFGPFSNIGANGAVEASFEVSNSLQGQFQIFDADGICTAFFNTQVDCNPNTECSITNVLLDFACQDESTFDVFIQFAHSNVTGDTVEIVDINGLSYGFFDVNQQPIIIQANTLGQGVNPFGVIINNPTDSNCVAESNIIGVECDIAATCSISNVLIDFACLDEDNYQVFVSFEHTGVEGNMVSITDITGNTIGFFDANQQPIIIEVDNSNGNNNTFGVFVESASDASCSAGSTVIEVDCATTEPCAVSFLEILNTECNTDGTFNLTVNYDINIQSAEEIVVNVNGENFNVVPNPNFVFTVEGVSPNSNSDFGLITICSAEFMNCCNEVDFLQPDCAVAQCEIGGIEYEAVCLDSTGSFMVNLFLNPTNSSGTVFVTTFAGQDLGQFDATQQPITVGPFSPDELDNNGIGFIVCDVQMDGCCAEVLATNINCQPIVEPCAVEFIEIISTECNTDGTYNLTASYSIVNQNNDFIDVSINGSPTLSFNNTGSLVINNITPRPNSDFDILEICLTDNTNCCLTTEYVQPNCIIEECEISGIEYEAVCIDSSGTFMVNLFFAQTNASGTVTVTNFAGQDLGQFDATQQPITVGPFGSDDLDNNGIGFIICDAQIDGCCAEVFATNIECEPNVEPCAVEFIEIISTECNTDGTYNLTVSYGLNIQNATEITVNVNGTDLNVTPNPNLVFTIEGITPRANSDEDIITICSAEFMNCCNEIEYSQPDCTTNEMCSIGFIEYEAICLDSAGTFMVNLFFNPSNTSGEVIVTSFNNEMLGQFGANQTPIMVGPFTEDDLDNGGIGFIVCDAQVNECCAEVFATNIACPNSNEPCEIEFIEVISTECNADSTYNLNATYSIANGDNDFINVTVNGGATQQLSNSGSILVTNIIPRTNSDSDIVEICLNDNPNCCSVIEYFQPNCTSEPQECAIEIVDVEFFCDDQNDEEIFFILDVVGNNNNDFLVFANGVQVGNGNTANQTTEAGPIVTNDDGFYLIEIIDANDATCRSEFELTQAFCPADCFIGEVDVVIECLDQETFAASITFPYDADHQDGVIIRGNGTDYGVFDGFDQPIVIDNLTASDSLDWEFIIIDNQDDSCQSTAAVGEVNCSDEEVECIIENIEVFDLDCIGGNEYSLSLNFQTGTNANIPFSFFINGESMSATTTNTLPLTLFGVLPNPDSNEDVITICLDDLAEECCVDFSFEQPQCLSNSVIDETLLDAVSMSPNPTSDMLYINDIPNEIIGLNVIDNLGRTVEQLSAQQNLNIDVTNYLNGVYTIQFFTEDNRVMSRRFIKM